MKTTVEQIIFDQEQYDGEWPPTNAARFIEWLNAKVETAPEHLRPTVTIEIDSESGYEGCHYGHIKIAYQRMETDQEAATRESLTAQRAESRKEALRRELRQLESQSTSKAVT